MYRIVDVNGKSLEKKTRVIITTDGPAKYRVKKDTEKKQLVITVIDAVSIWPKSSVTFDTGSVDKVSLRESAADKTVDVTLNMNENAPYSVTRDQNQIVVDIDKVSSGNKVTNRRLDLYQKISINVQDASINSILRLLSAQSGFEFTIGPSASTIMAITLREENQTLEQVLKDLLTPSALYYEIEGNIIRVGSIAELKGAKSLKPKMRKFYNPRTMKAEELNQLLLTTLSKEPLMDAVIQIDKSQGEGRLLIVGIESDIDKVMEMIRTMDGGGASDSEDFSEGGVKTKVFKLQYVYPTTLMETVKLFSSDTAKIIADNRTSSIIITDNVKYLKKIEGLIKKLDVKIKQVIIEAKLYEVDVNSLKNIGIRWSAENQAANPHILGDVVANPLSGAGELVVGLLQNGMKVSAIIDALESNNKATLLSSPRIAVSDNDTATIETTRTTYYQTTEVVNSTSGSTVATKYNPIQLPIKLLVGAKISDNKTILMSIQLEVSKILTAVTGGAPPDTALQKANTMVSAMNNETVVIGGLVTESVTVQEDKVPFLGDLPLLGGLFRGSKTSRDKVELVVFLTPMIIEEE